MILCLEIYNIIIILLYIIIVYFPDVVQDGSGSLAPLLQF